MGEPSPRGVARIEIRRARKNIDKLRLHLIHTRHQVYDPERALADEAYRPIAESLDVWGETTDFLADLLDHLYATL